MRNITLIGRGETLAPYVDALERDGFFAQVRPPGAGSELPPDTGLAIVQTDLPSEDSLVLELISGAGAAGAIPLIGLVSAEQVDHFELVRDLDDFVRIGADPADLVARVRRVIWRHDRVDPRNILIAGDLTMDLSSYTVHLAGRPVDLTYKEYELLRFLATNRDRVFSREALLSKVWGYDFYGGARTVDVHVRRLRSKIEDAHHTFIETVRNVGYRFRAVP
jgi:DNA-binding response OmpR family regulator